MKKKDVKKKKKKKGGQHLKKRGGIIGSCPHVPVGQTIQLPSEKDQNDKQ